MQFIEKAKLKHSEKYDYAKVIYKNNRTKVEITCPIHGVFFQTPTSHLRGCGCSRCNFDKLNKMNMLTFQEFIAKCKAKHGEKYNYSKSDYKGTRTKVIIICPIHGEFTQLPLNHFRYGCEKCSYETRNQRKPIDEFLQQAKSLHGDKYDYCLVNYQQAHTKVQIICSKHGVFTQTPNSHLRGRGCPECKKGEGHPRYGKSVEGSGYYGRYKNTIFRSMAELFWIIDAEKKGIKFLGLDQDERRATWQVPVTYTGRPGTYCADFYIYDTNEVIDIKPLFKQKIQEKKLIEGAAEYEKRGYKFRLVDTETIKVRRGLFKKMVQTGEVTLSARSQVKFSNRFD